MANQSEGRPVAAPHWWSRSVFAVAVTLQHVPGSLDRRSRQDSPNGRPRDHSPEPEITQAGILSLDYEVRAAVYGGAVVVDGEIGEAVGGKPEAQLRGVDAIHTGERLRSPEYVLGLPDIDGIVEPTQ